MDRRRLSAVALFALAFLSAALTLPGFGITWDEPGYVSQTRRVRAWYAMLLSDPGRAVTEKAIIEHWPLWEGGQSRRPGDKSVLDRLNPPFTFTLGALFASLFEGPLSAFTAHRLTGAFSYALVVLTLYLWIGRLSGGWAGLVAALSFALMPRVFGHAHVYATDLPATALMFAAAFLLSGDGRHSVDDAQNNGVKAFGRARLPRILLGAAILGLSFATKFTALIIVGPLLLPAIIKKDRGGTAWVLLSCAIGLAVMAAVNPALWRHPVERLLFYFKMSFHRALFIPIPTRYLGETYLFNLPWHHPLVMVLGTLPFTTVILASIGVGRALRNKTGQSGGLSHVIALAFFMGIFMLPGSPGHDGVRLFMPVFPFIAALCGLGFGWIQERLSGVPLAAAAIVFLLPGLAGIIRWHPYELSYYGLAVGGARGAERLGLETTYWMDALTPKNERSIVESTEGTRRAFADDFRQPLAWRIMAGRLGDGAYIDAQNPRWKLLIGRQGMMDDMEIMVWKYGSPKWKLRKNGVRMVGLFDMAKLYDGIDGGLDKLDRDSPRKWFLKGLLAEAKGDYGRALASYNKAYSEAPGLSRLALHRGVALREMGRYDESLAIFNGLAATTPTAEILVELGRSYAAAGNRHKALEAYKGALKIHINDPAALAELSKQNYK